MAEPTESQLKELWRCGVPLSSSWLRYAHPDRKSHWDSLPQPLSPEEFIRGLTGEDMPGTSFSERVQKLARISNPRAEAKRYMKADILDYIKNGHLFGFGYEPPRKLASPPVLIPKMVLLQNPNWEKDTVSGAGLNFIEVRLTTRQYWRAIYANQQNIIDVPKPVRLGRPTVGPAIEEAFHALHIAGEIDPNRSASSHYDKVRAWLAANKLDLPTNAQSLSHEVIRKNFMPLFKNLKRNHKL